MLSPLLTERNTSNIPSNMAVTRQCLTFCCHHWTELAKTSCEHICVHREPSVDCTAVASITYHYCYVIYSDRRNVRGKNSEATLGKENYACAYILVKSRPKNDINNKTTLVTPQVWSYNECLHHHQHHEHAALYLSSKTLSSRFNLWCAQLCTCRGRKTSAWGLGRRERPVISSKTRLGLSGGTSIVKCCRMVVK